MSEPETSSLSRAGRPTREERPKRSPPITDSSRYESRRFASFR